MVGIVIVSHSEKIAEGIKDLVLELTPNALIAVAGGTKESGIGTETEKIIDAIKQVYSEDGVMIFFDLGSAAMNAEAAIEAMPERMREKIKIMEVALIEGVITAAVESSIGGSMESIKAALDFINLYKAL